MESSAVRLSEVRCPDCDESFWQQQQVERGYRFRCFNGHVWTVEAEEFIYDAFEHHAVIEDPRSQQ